MTLRATVNTDASFCPRTKAGGWAAWVAIDGGKKIKLSGKFHKRPKNSAEAELWAIFNGVFLAAQQGVTEVLVQSDCKIALEHLSRDSSQMRYFFRRLPGEVRIRTKHVNAHTDTATPRTWVNDWCDKMAKNHMREQRAAGHPNTIVE